MRDLETKIRDLMVFLLNSLINIPGYQLLWSPIQMGSEHFSNIAKKVSGKKTSTEMVYCLIAYFPYMFSVSILYTPIIVNNHLHLAVQIMDRNDTVEIFYVPLEHYKNHNDLVFIHNYTKQLLDGFVKEPVVVDTPNYHMSFSRLEYYELIKYFEKRLQENYLKDAIYNCGDTVPEKSKERILEYLHNHNADERFCLKISSFITGELEIMQIEELLKENHVKRYLLTSNQGTEDEVTNEVLMTPEDIGKLEEIMREKEDYDEEIFGTFEGHANIYDINDEPVCYFFVSEYEEVNN